MINDKFDLLVQDVEDGETLYHKAIENNNIGLLKLMTQKAIGIINVRKK